MIAVVYWCLYTCRNSPLWQRCERERCNILSSNSLWPPWLDQMNRRRRRFWPSGDFLVRYFQAVENSEVNPRSWEGCHVYNLAMFLVYRATLLSFSSDVISIEKVVREIHSHFYLTNCNYLVVSTHPKCKLLDSLKQSDILLEVWVPPLTLFVL